MSGLEWTTPKIEEVPMDGRYRALYRVALEEEPCAPWEKDASDVAEVVLALVEEGDGCAVCIELEALIQTRRARGAAAVPDHRLEEAREVRIEDEAARRGIKLRGGNERSGPCPACGGTDRFSINVKKQLWNCRGCQRGGDVIALVRHLDGVGFEDAIETLSGRPAKRLEAKPARTKRNVVARFDYHDARGAVAYQVERVEYQNPDGSYVSGKDGKRKKDFYQRRPDPDRPGEWFYNLRDTRRVLYRLPELIEALAYGRTVVLVEGEAKADLLWSWNIPATCSPMGAKNWRGDLYAAALRGADIVVLPDNDPDGLVYLDAVAVSLTEVGASVRVLALPGLAPKGDIIDWERAGGTVEQLHALIEHEARPWVPGEPPRKRVDVNSEAFARNGAQHREHKPPSRVIGAGTFMRSYVPISYTLNGVIPSGYLYGITAKQGSGKTALMIAAALAVAFGREDILGCAVESGRVAYVTIENPVDFKMKLAVNCFVHNISYDEVETRIAIIDGRDTPEQIFDGLRLDAEANGNFQLVCFDTFQAGFAAANAGAFNDNEAVLGYLIRLRPLTTLPGSPSGLVAFHPTKNAGETELIPYGGGSTLNEVDGNLTLWKDGTIKLHHNRLRGPEFEPRFFRIEQLSCPGIVDKGGRQILLPVLRPTTEKDVEERARVSRDTKLELLRAMLTEPKGTQRDWAMKINLSVSTVNEKLKILESEKLVKKTLDAWFLTPKGENLAKS
jgi:hypothetical protein